MSVGMFLLIVVVSVALIVGAVILFGDFSDSRSALSHSQKKELANLRRLVKEINAEAHKYQELEPNFTSVTIDKISNHYQKELES